MCSCVCELLRWLVLLFINIKLVKYLNRAEGTHGLMWVCVFARDERFMGRKVMGKCKMGENLSSEI